MGASFTAAAGHDDHLAAARRRKIRPVMPVRLWSVKGRTATLIGCPDRTGRLLIHVDGERGPVRVGDGEWYVAPCCDYCAEPADVQLIDGQPEDVLCRGCAVGQFEHPREWVRRIPRSVVRVLVAQAIERKALR